MKKNKIIIILTAIFILTSCSATMSNENPQAASSSAESQTTHKSEQTDNFKNAVNNFNWVSYDNKPFMFKNIFANTCKISICDIDNDTNVEIILTDAYASNEASAIEVFKIINGALISVGGYWGQALDNQTAINIFENSKGENVFLTQIRSEHGGTENTFIAEVNADNYSMNVISAKVTTDNDTCYYLFNKEVRDINRSFFDGNFVSYATNMDYNEYNTIFEKYKKELKNRYSAVIYDSGTVNLGNFPSANEIQSDNFNMDEYMKHKDDPEMIDKTNKTVSKIIDTYEKLIL